MPAKLDRCVADVKAKGGVDNPWAVCQASINEEEVPIEETIMKQVLETKLKGCQCKKKKPS